MARTKKKRNWLGINYQHGTYEKKEKAQSTYDHKTKERNQMAMKKRTTCD